MPRVQLEISTGFYQSESLPISAQRCINLIPIIPQPQGSALNQRALLGAPGIKTVVTTGAIVTGSNRGCHVMGGIPFFVNGNTLFSLSSQDVIVSHGTVDGSGRVSMADNGTKLCIVVPGGNGFVFDGLTVTRITDPDYRPSDTVVFKDGFYVFTASDGDVFFNSALNDPLTFDALDFGTGEIDPDKIVAAHVNHNELFILGEETIEIFQNVGGAGFPFQRIPGANIQKGCHAKFTPINFDNTFVFVGGGENERSSVWKVTGSSSVQKISTSAIDFAIQEFTKDEISDAFSWAYSEDGNTFVGFTFESSGNRIPARTFAYDATSSALSGRAVWSERQSGVTDNRWRVNSLVEAHNKLLTSDQIDGRIGELDKSTFQEYGNLIFRQKASSPFSNQGNSQFWGEVELTLEGGVGLTSGQGSDPIIRMDFSDDGGRTFSNEFSRKAGKIGEFFKRVIWRRQGRIPAHRVIRFTMTDPIKWNIIKLEANIEGGIT